MRCTASGTQALDVGQAYPFSQHVMSELCPRPRTKNGFAPSNKRGSGAPKGAFNHSRAHRSASSLIDASGAARAADKYTQSAQLICLRGALAFRRSAAALARANASAVGSAPVPAFPETRSGGRYPLRSVSSLPRSAETGRVAGRAVAQSRPGAECIIPRAGAAPAPSFESVLAKGALSEQDMCL
jgi:hypothetical protein